MTFLAKFTNTNPRARLNFSWERSARRLVEIARHQYKEAYTETELPPRGQFVEQALVTLLLRDPAFKKLAESIKDGHAWFADIEAALDENEREDKKGDRPPKAAAKAVAPISAQATPTPTPVATIARPAWQNS